MDLVEGGVDMRDHRHHSSDSPPFHHLATDQAKSLIVLQELQNEVGALLEFRDVVMETFPQLRAKLRCGVQTGGGTAPAVSSARWEPGIRVRRKQRCGDLEQPQLRSRSNSRSKGGSGGVGSASSVVQDSGFCTESSKKTSEPDDELWCLLELIQNKGTRLRLEVESLKDKYGRSRSLGELGATTPPTQLIQANHAYQALLHEKELLLDRVTEMEAENLAQAAEANELTDRINRLSEDKRQLELLLGNGHHLPPPTGSGVGPPQASATNTMGDPTTTQTSLETTPTSHNQHNVRLGTLDGIVSSPTERIHCPKGFTPDKGVTAAILKETNILELRRHLITTTYENQVIQRHYDRISKYKANLLQQLEKFKEENEDLRFQLEEKSIELEGTRARVRLLERQTSTTAPPTIAPTTPPSSNQMITPPNHHHHHSNGLRHHSGSSGGSETCGEDHSSTESAHVGGCSSSSPRRKTPAPSRIPLKSYTAPKPPSAPPNSLRRSPRPLQQSTPNNVDVRVPTPAVRKTTPRLSTGAVASGGKAGGGGDNATDDSKVELDSLEKQSSVSSDVVLIHQEADRSLRSVELYDSIDTATSWGPSSDSRRHRNNSSSGGGGGDEAMADLDSLENINVVSSSKSSSVGTAGSSLNSTPSSRLRAGVPL